MFALHPRLEQDTITLGQLSLSLLLLMNDVTYPWFILVPQRENVCEIHDLAEPDQIQLIRESSQLSKMLAQRFRADKMNVVSLGNIVAQLHLHHIVRYRTDAAWPAPVWGRTPPIPYKDVEIDRIRRLVAEGLGDALRPFP
jgi:diadenosine tetraphosphate (Ap4A) HIT family hydrolase